VWKYIHGANGYLVDTFLQSSTNHRTDEYGGSIENRYRFLHEVLSAVQEVYPIEQVGLRISPNGAFGGMGSADNYETFIYVAQQLNQHYHDLAYLHVMDGLTFGFHNLCKPVRLLDIKRVFESTVIGNIDYTKDIAEGALRTGAADLVAFGRLYLSNPDLVERFQNNWPVVPGAPYEHWYGRFPNAEDALEGYLTYLPYPPETQSDSK
jgi:N-ethylmaleimide reductase